jgi:hypothetical protein
MKKYYILLSVILISCGQDFKQDLEKANSLFKENKTEEAKVYYEKAAAKGSADAHFALAYSYVVTKDVAIYHYSEAAKKGHQEALQYALESLFYRGNDLLLTNPKAALDLYKQAKIANPNIKVYDEEEVIKTLEMAASVPLLDSKQLIEKYNLRNDKGFGNDEYYIWELAETASRGQRFENPTNLLVLQLIVLGGSVPAELNAAFNVYYQLWRANSPLVEFNLCNFVTSGYGMGYCTSRVEKKENDSFDREIDSLKTVLNLQDISLLQNGYRDAVLFFDKKVWGEEGHDGSAYAAMGISSLLEHKRKYFETINGIIKGELPQVENTLAENDALLNEQYSKIITQLKQSPVKGMNMSITDASFREVQIQWLKYRDSNTTLFIEISQEKNPDYWNNFFTCERLKDYKNLEEIISINN